MLIEEGVGFGNESDVTYGTTEDVGTSDISPVKHDVGIQNEPPKRFWTTPFSPSLDWCVELINFL